MAHAMQHRFETEEPGSGRGFLREQRAEASARRIASTVIPFAELAFDVRALDPKSARAVSATAQSRSQSVWFVREAFRPDDRTATEARARFPSGAIGF
jgi:hypothetical protein